VQIKVQGFFSWDKKLFRGHFLRHYCLQWGTYTAKKATRAGSFFCGKAQKY